jgi:hypothetical protein
MSHLLLNESTHGDQVHSWSNHADLTCTRESIDGNTNTKSTLLELLSGMEADKLLSKKFIGFLDHQECFLVFFFVIEGRVWLDRTLMIALWVCAFVCIGSLHILLVLQKRSSGIRNGVSEEEGLQLNQNSLNGIT